MGEAYTKKGQNWRPESITLTSNNQTIHINSSMGKCSEIKGSDLWISCFAFIDIDRESLYQVSMTLGDKANNYHVEISRSSEIEPASFKQQISLNIFEPDGNIKSLIFGSHRGIVYLENYSGNPKPIAYITDEGTSPAIEEKLLHSIDFSLFKDKDLAKSIISQFISEQVIIFKEQSTPKQLRPAYKEIKDKESILTKIYLTDSGQSIPVLTDNLDNQKKQTQIDFSSLWIRYIASNDDQSTEEISILTPISETKIAKLSIRCDCSSPVKSICTSTKHGNNKWSKIIKFNQEGKISQVINDREEFLPIDIDYDNTPKYLLAKIIEGEILSLIPFFIFEQDDELAERLLTQFLEKSCARVLGIQEDIEKQNKRTQN